MNAIILKCKPGALFHFGEGSLVDVSHIIHSDTLFSAIANIYELVYEEGEEFVKLVEENKLNFSSAFPLLEEINSRALIYFLPKPNIIYKSNESLGKKEKKIKFLSLKAFKKISESIDNSLLLADFDLSEFRIIADQYALLSEEIRLAENDNLKFITEQIFPKTAVHKESRRDAFYFQTDIQLVPLSDENKKIAYKSHFYFLLRDSLIPTEKKKLITCLRILADEGIGGERGSGKGFVEEIIIKEFNDLSVYQTNYFMTVSLTNPASQSEFDNILRYDLIKRGGGSIGTSDENDIDFQKANYHRKQVRMVTEGSIANAKIIGRVVDVSPSVNYYKHKIYRNGKAFLIPLG